MKPSSAILVAGGVIAAALVVGRFVPLYQIAPGVDGAGDPMLWRLNVITGAVEICPAKRVVSAKQETGADPFEKIELGAAYGHQCQ